MAMYVVHGDVREQHVALLGKDVFKVGSDCDDRAEVVRSTSAAAPCAQARLLEQGGFGTFGVLVGEQTLGTSAEEEQADHAEDKQGGTHLAGDE